MREVGSVGDRQSERNVARETRHAVNRRPAKVSGHGGVGYHGKVRGRRAGKRA